MRVYRSHLAPASRRAWSIVACRRSCRISRLTLRPSRLRPRTRPTDGVHRPRSSIVGTGAAASFEADAGGAPRVAHGYSGEGLRAYASHLSARDLLHLGTGDVAQTRRVRIARSCDSGDSDREEVRRASIRRLNPKKIFGPPFRRFRRDSDAVASSRTHALTRST